MAETTTKAIGYIHTAQTTNPHTRHKLDIQAQRIREYCHINKIVLVGTFADEGIGGSTTARNGLLKALSVLREGQADLLIVNNMSRLTRSVAALASLTERHFADGSRALVSLDEHVDTRTEQGRFALHALCLIARWSRR